METTTFLELFNKYGLIIIFVINFLEQLNFPGLPAGIILPAIGMIIYTTHGNFIGILLLTVLAGTLGGTVMYFISRFAGSWLIELFGRKSARFSKLVEKSIKIAEYKNYLGLILIRLVPALRTITPIPSGMLKLPILKYIPYSAIGIFLFNFACIAFGYFIARGI